MASILKGIWTNGAARTWWQLYFLGDVKAGGRLVGTDRFGNRYYESFDTHFRTRTARRRIDRAPCVPRPHPAHASLWPGVLRVLAAARERWVEYAVGKKADGSQVPAEWYASRTRAGRARGAPR